jgi:hypothetical protein
MTEVPPPPATSPRVGLNPRSSDEVNTLVGGLLREFIVHKERVGHYQSWLAGVQLAGDPWFMDPDVEATIKAAVNGLDTSLDAVDMTFINRLVGIW